MEKITIITAPDDVVEDSVRILLVDLTPDQQTFVSTALKNYNNPRPAAVYLWNAGDSIEWLLDKKNKCDLIIFNAETTSQTIAGYFAAQPAAFYLGQLRELSIANPREILSSDQLNQLLEIIN